MTTTAAMAADDALLPLLPLLPLLDVVDAPDGGLALVLPLEERAPAAVRLERGRAFATADVADAARALGSALQQAHAAGTRHGALCPAVLYLGDGRPARVVGHGWLDAFVEAGADRGAVLATLGARGFAAPELLRTAGAHEPVPPLADVYALGATLYACMTGKPPFGGRTTALMMATVLADEGLSGEMPQLPRGDAAAQAEHAAATERLTQALLRAVERAPEDRWPTAGEFVRALDPRVPTPQPVLAQQQVPAMQARGCLASVLVLLTLAGIAATASALLAGYRV